ncbi:MAG: hypothetical protein PHR92_12595 [Lachnospiraceae bacterium]|nr:hypothetical protein [Lachnospiraceae bacterium]
MKKISTIPQTHYALDNSAIIHLAVMRKRYTNTFRLTATLTESVHSEILQKAVDNVTPQFPTIVAGIRRRLFQYEIVSSEVPPTVQQQAEILGSMTSAEIAYCAIRVLYCDRQISIECFHSLTDGYGGRVFLNALLVEYFRLLQTGKSCFTEPIPKREIDPAEWNDDFLTYAGEKSCSAANISK